MYRGQDVDLEKVRKFEFFEFFDFFAKSTCWPPPHPPPPHGFAASSARERWRMFFSRTFFEVPCLLNRGELPPSIIRRSSSCSAHCVRVIDGTRAGLGSQCSCRDTVLCSVTCHILPILSLGVWYSVFPTQEQHFDLTSTRPILSLGVWYRCRWSAVIL